MSRYTEDELIAYHLGEPCDAAGIREALEQDIRLAALSESIGVTLRVFSGEPVPVPGIAKAWERIRATLPPIERAPGHSRGLLWTWWIAGPAFGVALLLVTLALLHRQHDVEQADQRAAMQQLRAPGVPIQDPEIGQHLDRAERWLTEVSHTSQPLNADERAEAQSLLLRNAVYVRTAREHSDLPDAAVLERLGRVLTAAEHDQGPRDGGWHIRLEMNTDGLLLDIRILRQNQAQQTGNTL